LIKKILSNVKMEETIPTTPETKETIPEKEEPVAKTEPAPVQKSRGRPKGAADKAPRKKKIVIVEAPAQPSQASSSQARAPTPAPAPAPAPVPAPAPQEPEPDPPSPRTTMREASKSILQLRTLRDLARKTHLGTLYTEKLHRLT